MGPPVLPQNRDGAALKSEADPLKPPPGTEDWGRSGPRRKAEKDRVAVPRQGSHSPKTSHVFTSNKPTTSPKRSQHTPAHGTDVL